MNKKGKEFIIYKKLKTLFVLLNSYSKTIRYDVRDNDLYFFNKSIYSDIAFVHINKLAVLNFAFKNGNWGLDNGYTHVFDLPQISKQDAVSIYLKSIIREIKQIN